MKAPNVIAATSVGYLLSAGNVASLFGYSRGSFGALVPENRPLLNTGELIQEIRTDSSANVLRVSLENPNVPDTDASWRALQISGPGFSASYLRSAFTYFADAGGFTIWDISETLDFADGSDYQVTFS